MSELDDLRRRIEALEVAEEQMTDYALEVARGRVSGVTSVNNFGHAPDGMQTTVTDIWSRADSAATQQIWLAPTAARIHAIVSTAAADTQNVIIWGLKTWDTAETSETVVLNGTTPVNTANSYVIIHRMKFTPTLAKTTLAGVVSATAATDGTVTAIIRPGSDGQTQMAIYGVPSTQSFYLTRWVASMGKEPTTQSVSFELRVNENPNVQTTGFLLKNEIKVLSSGSSGAPIPFTNPQRFDGPCIIKVQGVGSTTDIDVQSAFDGYLVTN